MPVNSKATPQPMANFFMRTTLRNVLRSLHAA
jgi:hypothetical protein